jgi:hypothetical protein
VIGSDLVRRFSEWLERWGSGGLARARCWVLRDRTISALVFGVGVMVSSDLHRNRPVWLVGVGVLAVC